MNEPNLLAIAPTLPPERQDELRNQARLLEERFVLALRRWYDGEIEAGLTALELKQSRVYQYYANDWPTYCEGVLGASRTKVDRLIDQAITKREMQAALQAAGKLGTVKASVMALLPLVASDSVIRRIVGSVPALERPEVIRRLVAAPEIPTVDSVRKLAAQVERENKPLTTDAPPLPPVLVLRAPFEDLMEKLRSTRYALAQLATQEAGQWLRQNPEEPNSGLSSRIGEPLARLGELLRAAAPFKMCPRCMNKPNYTCELCLGAGWLTEQKAKAAKLR